MNRTIYINIDEVIDFHDEVISLSGGMLGLRDEGLLRSALSAIQNDLYYPSLFSKLTHLIVSINKNHCFTDGNKRASIISGALLLLKNGYPIQFVKRFILAMEDVAVWIAQTHPTNTELELIIEFIFLNLKEDADIDTKICNQIEEIGTFLAQIERYILTQIQLVQDEIIEDANDSELAHTTTDTNICNQEIFELKGELNFVHRYLTVVGILLHILAIP